MYYICGINKKTMGQYYQPIFLDEPIDGQHRIKAFMYSHDYGNGLKLMEHSWLKNKFVQTFEKQLSRRGEFYKSRVVWAGDYAEYEEGTEINLFDLCDKESDKKIKPKVSETKDYNFLVNHTKKQFVDKSKVPNVNGWVIHPLPLLTCEGNGRGGGDFRGDDENEIVGSWARDVISVEKENPKMVSGTMDYQEIVFNLCED